MYVCMKLSAAHIVWNQMLTGLTVTYWNGHRTKRVVLVEDIPLCSEYNIKMKLNIYSV